MAARSAIRAVGRALDLSYSDQDYIAKMIPFEPGITIESALDINKNLKNEYTINEKYKILIDNAIALEGLPLYVGTHAAGVLITDEKGVTSHAPLWKTEDGIVAQYDMNILEELGLLKMDFLGLKTLTIIQNTKKFVKKNYNVDIDLDSLYDCEDLAPLELIRNGYTEGIFQLEGLGMTQFMTELKPRSIEDIIAGISLYRPGPLQYIPMFLQNKRNESNISYVFDELRPILYDTYGILCYQEQCMRVVIALAGYQKHHSDSFRKAIGKKKADLIAQHREYFIEGRNEQKDENGNVVVDYIPGAVRMGFDIAKLEKLYDEMEEFGKYASTKRNLLKLIA